MSFIVIATAVALPSDIVVALRQHLRWQRRLLEHNDLETVKFLVLNPKDAHTMCYTAHLATGQCGASHTPYRVPLPTEHWDQILLDAANPANARHVLDGKKLARNLPGLGNIALALASAAVAAMLSRRVLVLENWTVASETFAAPLPDLLVGNGQNGWDGPLSRTQSSGVSRLELFLASDSMDSAFVACTQALDRRTNSSIVLPEVTEITRKEMAMAGERQVDYPQLGEARIVRIFSNQYFMPLFYLNPHHREQLRIWMRTSSANNISSTSSGRLFVVKD